MNSNIARDLNSLLKKLDNYDDAYDNQVLELSNQASAGTLTPVSYELGLLQALRVYQREHGAVYQLITTTLTKLFTVNDVLILSSREIISLVYEVVVATCPEDIIDEYLYSYT